MDDDPVTRTTLASYFKDAGYRVSEAADGDGLWRQLSGAAIDLVFLDIALPGQDGLTLLREIRRTSDIAVILLTGKTDEIDRILGLELGAHDYVTKPFNSRELLARAKNLIRLTKKAREANGEAASREFSGWTLDHGARQLTDASGEVVPLTRAEFDLLAALLANAGRVMTRDNLLDRVSHRDWDPTDRTIDVLVGRVRRKIEDDPHKPKRVITVHGVGYLFAAAEADAA